MQFFCIYLLLFFVFIFNNFLSRKTEYLRKIGNRDDVANYRKAEQELIDSVEKCAVDGSFKQWKNKVTVTSNIKCLDS